tara:strand:- start:736 stop:1482 length:747 start_codon:yes stop_codon:yes gene_type:complete
MKISLVIPCYNYENLIREKFYKLKKKLNDNKIKYEIIYINDGSSDKTLKKLREIKNKNKNIKIINNKINLGKSSSLIKGINKSKYNNIIIYDCDLPYFGYLNKIIYDLKNFDFVYINRKSNKSRLKTKSLNFYQISRFIIGRLMCLFINLLCLNLSVGDTQAGLKAFKKPKKFKNIKFLSFKFFFDAELMIIFFNLKKKMKYISVKYEVPKDSSIKIFEFKNLNYIYELLKIVIFYKFVNFNKFKKLL